VKIAYPLLLLALALPVAASAQTPQPDERAAAQAFAEAAERLIEASEAIDEGPAWAGECRALRREPPERYDDRARAFADGLALRDLIDELKPAVRQARSELANALTADPVLISGRASVRQMLRAIDAFPAPEADPCAAYEAYVRAGYPRGPAREALAWDRRLSTLASRGRKRKILAAADRMKALGVSPAGAQAFSQLAY
jgi:hypothetical protein